MAETHQRLIGRLAAVLAGLHDIEPGAERLCEAGRMMLDAEGAALSLMTSPDSVTVVASTDALAAQLEDLQEVVGEGPSRDAFGADAVQIARFAAHGDGKWTLMHEHGARLGFDGAMIVPLRPHDRPIGILSAYRRGGDFTVDPQTADFLGVALGAALLKDAHVAERDDGLGEAWSSRAEVHQATGMIIAQVGVRPEDALALLRGQAFAHDTTMLDVAHQIVERRINLAHPNRGCRSWGPKPPVSSRLRAM
jgi:hypothetical protein